MSQSNPAPDSQELSAGNSLEDQRRAEVTEGQGLEGKEGDAQAETREKVSETLEASESIEALIAKVEDIDRNHSGLFNITKDYEEKGLIFMERSKKGKQKKWKAVVSDKLKEEGNEEEVKAVQALCDAINAKKKEIREKSQSETATKNEEKKGAANSDVEEGEKTENEAIEVRINEDTEAVEKTTKFKNGKTGVIDIGDKFMEENEGTLIKKSWVETRKDGERVMKTEYRSVPRNNVAKPFAEALNKRLKELEAIGESVRNNKVYEKMKAKGDYYFDKDGNKYAFKLDLKHGEGADVAIISNLVVVKGEVPSEIKDGEISCADIEEGEFLDWAVNRRAGNH